MYRKNLIKSVDGLGEGIGELKTLQKLELNF
jgi:hypothetical protein